MGGSAVEGVVDEVLREVRERRKLGEDLRHLRRRDDLCQRELQFIFHQSIKATGGTRKLTFFFKSGLDSVSAPAMTVSATKSV